MTEFKIGDRVRLKLSIFHQLGSSGRRAVVIVTGMDGNIATFDKPILYEWIRLHVANIEKMVRK